MLYLQRLILFALSSVPLCSATKVLPRAQHAAAGSEAFVEIQDVMLGARNIPRARNAAIARRWDETSVPSRDASSESPLALVKRMLLGKRQLTCDPGYGLCNSSETCCPEGDNGKCCDDGTCVTSGQVCCSNGGACDAGLECCGPLTCAPAGGECCNNGESCDPGLHCVVLNGVQGCCQDLSCTEFGSGGAAPALPSFTFTPISITPLTPISFTPISFTPISITPISFTPISFTPISFTPLSFPSITMPSFTPLSFPSITIPTPIVPPVTDQAAYSYFTTTWTWYYYTYFITTVPPSLTTPTSTQVTTTTTFSVYATDYIDANYQFASITSAVSIPTAITAPGFTSEVAALSASSSSPTAFGGGVGGKSTGSLGGGAAAESGSRGRCDGFATLLLGGCLGMGIGLLAVWL